MPPQRHPSVRIVLLRAPRDTSCQCVQDHVTRPAIEGDDVFQLSARGKKGDIGDSAQVLDGSSLLAAGEQNVVRERYKRRSLSVEGHIRGAKISDYEAACL